MSAAAPTLVPLFSRLRTSFVAPTPGDHLTQVSSPVPSRSVTPPAMTPVPKTTTESSLTDKLDLLDQVLTEVEQTMAAPVTMPPLPPVAPPVATSPAAPPPLSPKPLTQGSGKESLSTAAVEQPIVDSGSGFQVLEVEANPEIPVEVENFIQHVEDHSDQLQQEIVIADGTVNVQPLPSQMQSVIVLPITPESEAKGKSKGVAWSIRWLVEWSHKLMKMFSGKIVYREA